MSVVLAGMLGAVISGRQLPWLAVAVRAVTTGENLRGVWFIDSHSVVFMSIPSGEIDPGRSRMLVIFHVVIVPICSAIAVLVVVASRRARDRRRADALLVEARHPPVVEILLERDRSADGKP